MEIPLTSDRNHEHDAETEIQHVSGTSIITDSSDTGFVQDQNSRNVTAFIPQPSADPSDPLVGTTNG
jgi:hypothetical protein